MFRHFARSTLVRPAIAFSRPRWAGHLLLGGSASAMAYYMATKSKIYADVVEVTAASKQTTPWTLNEPPSTDYLLNWHSMAEVPPEETGIMRIESVIIQRYLPMQLLHTRRRLTCDPPATLLQKTSSRSHSPTRPRYAEYSTATTAPTPAASSRSRSRQPSYRPSTISSCRPSPIPRRNMRSSAAPLPLRGPRTKP